VSAIYTRVCYLGRAKNSGSGRDVYDAPPEVTEQGSKRCERKGGKKEQRDHGTTIGPITYTLISKCSQSEEPFLLRGVEEVRILNPVDYLGCLVLSVRKWIGIKS